jgi:membrane protein YdbS with pleckstrin-like domain
MIALSSIPGILLPVPAWLAPVLVTLAGALGVWLGPKVRYWRWRYALGEENLEIRHGVLWTTVTVIPYARLQFVDTRQGPLERLLGLASLVVHTAAVGTSGTLPGLAAETAAELRQRLAAVLVPSDELPV